MLVRVLYISEVSPGVTALDIDRLVAHARRRNRQLDLTGALLACDGHFAQVLEGHEVLLEEMMRKIAVDTRHRDLRVLERTVIRQRLFSDWDMAFVDESRCGDDFRNLLAGDLAPGGFMMAMGAWIEDYKTAPF